MTNHWSQQASRHAETQKSIVQFGAFALTALLTVTLIAGSQVSHEQPEDFLAASGFEQMPGTVIQKWPPAVDLGIGIAALGTFWFISRRRKSKANQREELF